MKYIFGQLKLYKCNIEYDNINDTLLFNIIINIPGLKEINCNFLNIDKFDYDLRVKNRLYWSNNICKDVCEDFYEDI